MLTPCVLSTLLAFSSCIEISVIVFLALANSNVFRLTVNTVD